MKQFHAGDKVRFLSSKESGIVTSIKNGFVYVMIEDGFEIPVEPSDLVLIDLKEGKRNPFIKKNEFSNLESTIRTETSSNKTLAETNDGSGKNNSITPDGSKHKNQNQKNAEALINGIYLAFVPENQNTLISGDMEIYLINYSRWQVAFHILKSHSSKGFESISSGFIEKGDAVLIDSVSEYTLKEMAHLRLQIMCFDIKQRQLFDSEIVDIEIKTSKFIKEDIYLQNPFFDELAHIIFVHDLTHPPLSSFKKAPIQEKNGNKTASIIERFMIDNSMAEIDLHIEKLRSDHKSLHKSEILPLQIAFFRQCLDAAIAKQLKKVVFIHGVGAGLLKKEINDILKSYSNLEFEDASILKYGIGATEVRFI